MSTNNVVIIAFVTQVPRDVKSNNLRYDSRRKTLHSYNYLIGHWLNNYAVIRAHDALSKTTARHMSILDHTLRARSMYSIALPILTPTLFERLSNCNGEPGWDRSYFPLYQAYAAKAARAKRKIHFDNWKQQMVRLTENLDKIATVFDWSYDRGIYTPENVLADDPKLLEQYALRDMGVWEKGD